MHILVNSLHLFVVVIVFILDGSSEHVAHAYREIGLCGKNKPEL